MKTILALIAATLLSQVAFSQTPLPEHAKVLERYVGTWELSFSNLPNAKFTEQYEWVMDGKFISKSIWPASDGRPMAMTNMQMMQFDNAKGSYRQWTFTSTGAFFDAEGRWEPSTKALTWTGHDPGSKTTTVNKATMVDADTDSISVKTTDSSGKVIQEKTAQRKRKK